MDIFLKKCLQLLPVLGVADLSEKIDKASNVKDLLYCKIKGLTASGKRTANGFVVFEGSQAVLEHRPSAMRMQAKREQLIKKGLLQNQDGHLVFAKDVEFGSPSTAGSVIRGGSTNGLTNWKNSSGVPLKEIEANET